MTKISKQTLMLMTVAAFGLSHSQQAQAQIAGVTKEPDFLAPAQSVTSATVQADAIAAQAGGSAAQGTQSYTTYKTGEAPTDLAVHQVANPTLQQNVGSAATGLLRLNQTGTATLAPVFGGNNTENLILNLLPYLSY